MTKIQRSHLNSTGDSPDARDINCIVLVGDTTIKNMSRKDNTMLFLKEILGEDLFKQFETAINAWNGNEANKEKLVKLANLSTGDYVGKGKYEALEALLQGKEAELTTANGLIEQLKKGTKGNEELQGKITQYETTVTDLQAQLQEAKIKSAIKVALLSEKAVDVDYLTYKLNEKLKEKGEALELDENDNIKGWDDKISGLKTQFPTMFEAGTGNKKVLGDGKLPEGDNNEQKLTKEDFDKMGYKSRVELKANNPELYETMMKG